MRLTREQIQERAMQVLEANPQGIRWTSILKAVEAESPETPHNSVHGGVHKLLTTRTTEIIKVARGTYQLAKFVDADVALALTGDLGVTASVGQPGASASDSLNEADFYGSFAEWLEENDEATVAAPIGGSSFGGKWGTPDVIGVLKPTAADIFKFQPQIVTAEIKSVPSQPVVAFGQAVAYRLFSHRSYVVVPNTTTSEDINRLISLCSIHGVGLVTFTLSKEQPDYTVIVQPQNAEPDVFYVNYMLDRMKANHRDLLNRLF